jgi:hypothetical protein
MTKRQSRMQDRSKRVTKLSSGFRVSTYRPTPEGFDPTKATKRQLILHGIPPRPDASKDPDLRSRWDQAIAKTKRWIIPEFLEIPGKTHGLAKKIGTKSRRKLAGLTNATSANWSGAVDFPPTGAAYFWAAGQWTVPNPHAPGSGAYYASEWVGIDGWNSADVCQAGTETQITNVLWFTVKNVYPWWEWFPSGEVAITNLPVAAGDVMYCLICVSASNAASIYLSNQSTGDGTSFDITAPSGTSLVGDSVEWIIERPGVNGTTASLSEYGVGYFDECLAGSLGSAGFGADNLHSATAVTMTGTGGKTLSSPTIENDNVLKLEWKGAS